VDTTLQQTKTRVFFTEEQVFLIQDEFIIPIPSELSEMYLDQLSLKRQYSYVKSQLRKYSVELGLLRFVCSRSSDVLEAKELN